MSGTETGCCYEIDPNEFGSLKAHALGGVEHFAFNGIVNENLKVFRALINHDSQTIPFGYVSLPIPRSFGGLAHVPILREFADLPGLQGKARAPG
uniref:Uncharacterized protein n=1 Tax=Solibacter usitatus (strain Ellin6076) TaxID=234267 RepID=Q01PA3_SOLUE